MAALHRDIYTLYALENHEIVRSLK